MFIDGALYRLIGSIRDLRSRALFKTIELYCHGDVLDIGGWNFYARKVINNPKIKFKNWINLEPDDHHLTAVSDKRYKLVIGDGCATEFSDMSFDTVLNIQVLEHVFEPIKMVKEIGRVLKPGGYGIFLIPQTSVLHHAPEHYYNFTRYWISKAMGMSGLEIVSLKTIGGFWTSLASHLVYFFVQSAKVPGYSTADHKRNTAFYLLFPFMCLYALISIPICLVFGWGDLSEEPNNHWVVVRKVKANG